jgi:hypothetical protein
MLIASSVRRLIWSPTLATNGWVMRINSYLFSEKASDHRIFDRYFG